MFEKREPSGEELQRFAGGLFVVSRRRAKPKHYHAGEISEVRVEGEGKKSQLVVRLKWAATLKDANNPSSGLIVHEVLDYRYPLRGSEVETRDDSLAFNFGRKYGNVNLYIEGGSHSLSPDRVEGLTL